MVRPALDGTTAWDPVGAALAARFAAPPAASGLEAVPVAPLEGGWALGAVDGGSAVVLEGGGLAVGALRTSALAWARGALAHDLAGPLEVVLLDGALARALEGLLPGLPPAPGPEALLDRLRARREWEQAMALVPRLGEGDVLALDGSLAPRDWPATLRAALAEACAQRGVLVVGFCKGTSATLDGAPALLAAARAARRVPEPWVASLPGPPGARHAAARFVRGGRVFKVELPASADPGEAVAKLAPFCRDAGTPGYPFPLTLAHQRCALDDALADDLAHALREAAARRGVAAEAWEEVFGDFHDVLDRGV